VTELALRAKANRENASDIPVGIDGTNPPGSAT